MKAVRTLQKYQCDFCKKRSVKHVIAIHEKRCFRNPNRYCDFCDNTGEVSEVIEGVGEYTQGCPYCSRFDEKKLKEIQAREKQIKGDK